ncbi:lipoprotein NlpI [Maioricimonas rarisocia]|uniref:Lipoprotein NlpI n=1 Tax=Maioricimonas rarisocia TaxID=2528026 RepID=A0A517YZY1_9PLAN|nr:tetratricopeptide repeat protein [Maioricimonas rarisocia]QDU35796.1 lipoprotein NlpI [Maioricimonas rarisocia]
MQTAQRPARSTLPAWKKALFAASVLIGFFLLLEGALALWGVSSADESSDPFAGFAGRSRLFVPVDDDREGCLLQTSPRKLQWFNPQTFACEKPAGTKRIFCLGGSTTYGRPYRDPTSFAGWLREFLTVADPETNWEVINAGGVSYASYRIARIANEITNYEPDVVIVYTGHNEFLERRTYESLMQTPEPVREVGGWLSELRTFTVLKSVLAPSASPQDSPSDDPADDDVKTILESTVGLEAYERDDRLRDGVVKDFRANLAHIVDVARNGGAQVLVVTPACQLRDCRPFKSEHRADLTADQQDEFEAAYEGAEASLETGDVEAALSQIQTALEIDDRYALAHYLHGRVLWQLERPQEAKEAFIRARDEDVCPLRAISPIVDAVEDVAFKRDVPLVDFVRLTASLSEQGVPGANLFLDHVHPTIEGHRDLALALLVRMKEMELYRPGPDWNEEIIARVTDRVKSTIDPAEHAQALVNLSKVLSWAGKYEEADRLALRAGEMLSTDADALYQAGSALYRQGNIAGAMEQYRKAVEADPQSARAQFGLGLTLAESGRHEEAVEHYRIAAARLPGQLEIRFNLGNSLMELRKPGAASRQYEAATLIQPDFAPAYNSLGIALAQLGDLRGAARNFRKAVELDPSNEDARSNLKRALNELGE